MKKLTKISLCKTQSINNFTSQKNNSNLSNTRQRKIFQRTLSTGNIEDKYNVTKLDNYKKNYQIFPAIYSNYNNSVFVIKKPHVNYQSLKNNSNIEIEKIYIQNSQFQLLINRMTSELKKLNKELKLKQKILLNLNNEIEKYVNQYNNEENNQNSESEKESLIYNTNAGLARKMKLKTKEAEQELLGEIFKEKLLRKNIKFTKSNELTIEKNLIQEQFNKISQLLLNSKNLSFEQDKEITENQIFYDNLESQINIINNLEEKYQSLIYEEKYLENDMVKYGIIRNQLNDKIELIKIKQLELKDQNMKLTKEKFDFMSKNSEKDYNLNILQEKLYQIKKDYKYFKIKNQKTSERLNNLKENYKFSLAQYKKLENKKLNNMTESKGVIVTQQKNTNFEENDEQLTQLRKIYQENKNKENELEKNLYRYQIAIKQLNKTQTENNVTNEGENINIDEIRNNIIKIINPKSDNDKKDNNDNNNNISNNNKDEENNKNKILNKEKKKKKKETI